MSATCTKVVYKGGSIFRGSTCGRPAVDTDETGNPRCKIHSTAAAEKRRARSDAAFNAKREQWKKEARELEEQRNAVAEVTRLRELVRRAAECIQWGLLKDERDALIAELRAAGGGK